MEYIVKYGDCLSTIARRYGMTWRDLWEHPKNAEFRAKRKDPNIIYPGDCVHIPVHEQRLEPGATEQQHVFRFLDAGVKLQVRVLNHGEPLEFEPYRLEIDGLPIEGETDGEGVLLEPIPSDARRAVLHLTDLGERRALELGGLDPVDELSGVQGRLHNLGYLVGPIDGIWGPLTSGAVERFQKFNNLSVTGCVDSETRATIARAYGS